MMMRHYNVQIAVTPVLLVISIILSMIIGPNVIFRVLLSKMHLHHELVIGMQTGPKRRSRSNDHMSFINEDEDDSNSENR